MSTDGIRPRRMTRLGIRSPTSSPGTIREHVDPLSMFHGVVFGIRNVSVSIYLLFFLYALVVSPLFMLERRWRHSLTTNRTKCGHGWKRNLAGA
ncbi:hypothetical protein L227DRAFT_369144 [Lentinus tigrinus ALCF2SS1-6]|uniref:Uncharacterized protein n=1 Tax=Lentinus tigrinus ALCF2SS1-6 TaxID=1328759 RepID=A0A5C2RRI3_9APHY|nr:hypothetical protein L227DRAFT_369144 [Lentinus tigrinus ALCF2SS1-6]